jgi:hypothetical protein
MALVARLCDDRSSCTCSPHLSLTYTTNKTTMTHFDKYRNRCFDNMIETSAMILFAIVGLLFVAG